MSLPTTVSAAPCVNIARSTMMNIEGAKPLESVASNTTPAVAAVASVKGLDDDKDDGKIIVTSQQEVKVQDPTTKKMITVKNADGSTQYVQGKIAIEIVDGKEKDNRIHSTEKKWFISGFVKNAREMARSSDNVQVLTVADLILTIISIYVEHVDGVEPPRDSIEKPLKTNNLKDSLGLAKNDQKAWDEDKKTWFYNLVSDPVKLMSAEQKTTYATQIANGYFNNRQYVYDLLNAVNYLSIPFLMDLVSAHVATWIKGQSLEKVKIQTNPHLNSEQRAVALAALSAKVAAAAKAIVNGENKDQKE